MFAPVMSATRLRLPVTIQEPMRHSVGGGGGVHPRVVPLPKQLDSCPRGVLRGPAGIAAMSILGQNGSNLDFIIVISLVEKGRPALYIT